MREMTQPAHTARDVYLACVAGISNASLKRRMEDESGSFAHAAICYLALATTSRLYTFPVNNKENCEIIFGEITKEELKSMYSYYMVGTKMPARAIYDSLIAAAPNGLCPLCGVGYAITLDHYLPKGKFPLFSIIPQNLVPACRDCNTGKSANSASTLGEQSLHPYFDHGSFISEQWLYAEVGISSPVSIRFLTNPPEEWSNDHKQRVTSHFNSLNLASRFSILAANELSSLSSLLINYVCQTGPDAVREYLNACAAAEFRIHRNSWKTAMFQALAADRWYCTIGFRLI